MLGVAGLINMIGALVLMLDCVRRGAGLGVARAAVGEALPALVAFAALWVAAAAA